MRLNILHTFLRSGRLFFYRGIFSGLSNETMGAALYVFFVHNPSLAVMQYSKASQQFFSRIYKLRSMNKTAPALVAVIIKYDAPLQRYARFILKDSVIAAALVKEIFELVYDENGFAKPEDELRHQLKEYTFTACNHWLRVQALHKFQNN